MNIIIELKSLFNDDFKQFKNILLQNDKERINKMKKLLNTNLLEYYIRNEYACNSDTIITKCIETLDEINKKITSNQIVLNDDGRYIFDIVYQAFKDRKELLDKSEKHVNNIDNNNKDNK